ncbi:hypothetical protein PQ469_27715 [Mucilaginibacter sp. KACC 22773]|uniref:hypothetical protein n=1 Tax=Mucilaginibacter sp. KACC 22773 TaxID=3025671 RepID=UPI002366726D|nr:hypothetical protein [Mucilaginibacter sp. KACC 22773]WDF77681.1 hypothetical protein PQ469_27715 [Mucilaginibacter sp. KACC 22773]
MENTLTSQQAYIERFIARNTLFHKGYTNNYSIELVSVLMDLPLLKKQRIDGLELLNNASYNLCDFCIKCLSEIKATGALSNARAVEINTVLKNWRYLIKGGNSFATYDYAAEITHSIKMFGYPFLEKLQSPEFKHIPAAFVAISGNYKYFVRINCFLPSVFFEEAFSIVLDILESNYLIYSAIERIEVAKEDFPLSIDNREPFPTFSIIFDYSMVSSPEAPVIKNFIALYNKKIAHLKSGLNFNYFYSKNVGHGLTLSQGFKNYKRYLKLIDQLDNVYDESDNYAFSLMFNKKLND